MKRTQGSARCIFSVYISDQVARQPLILSITLHTILQYYLFYIYSWYYIIHIIYVDMYYLSFACPACYHSLSRNDMLESFQTMCRRITILHILCWWIWWQPAAYNHQPTSQLKISVCIKKRCVWDMIPLMPMPYLFCWYYDFKKIHLINFLSHMAFHIPQCKQSIYYYIIHLCPQT